MEIEFDPEKSAKNEKERGLPFELVRELDWTKARISRDNRHDYGEERLVAFVPKHGRLYFVCFCVRETTTRVISFRKAKKKEVTSYGKTPDAAPRPTSNAAPTSSSDASSTPASDRRRGRGPRTDR
jgi:uncharacterized protein